MLTPFTPYSYSKQGEVHYNPAKPTQHTGWIPSLLTFSNHLFLLALVFWASAGQETLGRAVTDHWQTELCNGQAFCNQLRIHHSQFTLS